MFKGVIHANARAILPDFIARMPGRVINICSGNFTLETTLRLNGFAGRLEGCDISLYTSALGRYFTGQDWRITVAKDAEPDVQRFAEFLTDPEGKAAVIAIALDLTEHAKRRNEFQRRMWRAYISSLPKLIEGTRARLRKKKEILRMDGFHARDGVEVIRENAESGDLLIMSSPPTYEKGYERLYATLMSWFDWDAPTYTDIGPRAEFAKVMRSDAHNWLMFSEDRNDEVESVLGRPKAQTARGPNKNVYLYTDLPVPPKLIRREVECSANHPYPRMTEQDVIRPDSKVTFVRTSFKEANYFRQLYSSVIPMQASAMFCYLLMVDGKAFGQVMFQLPSIQMTWAGKDITAEYLYMMSDLPIASERYPRLSKLVLAATLSREFQAELEHRTTRSVNVIFTTAFSEKPASMKYRGVYQIHSRKGPDEHGHFSINYIARIGQRPMKDLMREWLSKHGKVSD